MKSNIELDLNFYIFDVRAYTEIYNSNNSTAFHFSVIRGLNDISSHFGYHMRS